MIMEWLNEQQFNKSRKPIIRKFPRNRPVNSIGSTLPHLLYEKGQIIYKSVENKKLKKFKK
jgi:hypothetical protein